MIFYSLTYDAVRRSFTIWMVNYHDDLLPCETKFDRVLEVRDSDFGKVEEAIEELKDEFGYVQAIGPFKDIIPCTPKATKLIIKIAESIADQRGYNQGRIDFMRDHQ